MTTREKCSLCEWEVDYRWSDAGATFGDSSPTQERIAWRCHNPECPNHNPANHTFGWAVPIS